MGKVTEYLSLLCKRNNITLDNLPETALLKIFSGYGQINSPLFLDEMTVDKWIELVKPIYPSSSDFFPRIDKPAFLALIQQFTACLANMRNSEPGLEITIQALFRTKKEKDIKDKLRKIEQAYLFLAVKTTLERIAQQEGELTSFRAHEIKFQEQFLHTLIDLFLKNAAEKVLNNQKALFGELTLLAVAILREVPSFATAVKVRKAVNSIMTAKPLVEEWFGEAKSTFFTKLKEIALNLLSGGKYAHLNAVLFAIESDQDRYRLFAEFFQEKILDKKNLESTLHAMIEVLLESEKNFGKFVDLIAHPVQKITVLKLIMSMLGTKMYSAVADSIKEQKTKVIVFHITTVPYLIELARGSKDLIEADAQLLIKDQMDIDARMLLLERLQESVKGTFLEHGIRDNALNILKNAMTTLEQLKESGYRGSKILTQQVYANDALQLRSIRSTADILDGFQFDDEKMQKILTKAVEELRNANNNGLKRWFKFPSIRKSVSALTGIPGFFRAGDSVDLPADPKEIEFIEKKNPQNNL